jgi:hypothetical protein
MPGSGIAATREITSRLPGTKVVMITVSFDDDEHRAQRRRSRLEEAAPAEPRGAAQARRLTPRGLLSLL